MARSPDRGMTVCTEPLPKVVRPMSFARWLSLRAPATISAADTDPPLINTTIGAPLSASPAVASISNLDSGVRPFAVTMTPLSRKVSDTATAASSTPPGLLRKSSTSPLSAAPLRLRRSLSAASRSSPVVSLNWETRTYPMPGSSSSALTLQGELQRFCAAFTQNTYLDRGSFLAAHAPDRVRQGGRIHGNSVDRRDDVPGVDPGRGRRRPFERRHHHDLFVLHRHLDADA